MSYVKIDLEEILAKIPKYPDHISLGALSARTGASRPGISRRLAKVSECLVTTKFYGEYHYSKRS